MDIQTVLDGAVPYNARSYEIIAEVIDGAYVELSFWGGRNVYSMGHSGSISLIDLAQKIIDLVASHPNYSHEEQKLGLLFEKKLERLDHISTHQQQRANFLTQFFMMLMAVFGNEGPADISYKVCDACLFQNAIHFGRSPCLTTQ